MKGGKRFVSGNIDQICQQLLRSRSNRALIDKVLGEGIRQRVVDKDSLPLVIQRLTVGHSDWVTALQVLESAQLDKHRVRRDDNIWPILEKGVPLAGQKHMTEKLKTIYGVKSASGHTPRSNMTRE